VLGGNDPSTPAALRAYADDAEPRELDPEYIASIRELAEDFAKRDNGEADPDAGPHRKDNPAIIKLMRGQGDLTHLKDPDTLKTLTLTWTNGNQTVVERVKYLSYDRGGSFMSEGPKFLYVHGEEGTPREIFRIDDRLRHMKLEEQLISGSAKAA
jgi:hypothetical protein